MRQLSLANNKLDSSCLCRVALLHDRLQTLDLPFTKIDTAALTQYASVPWQRLRFLILVGNMLTEDAIASLISAEIPNLTSFDLENSKLNAAAARCVAKGNWPKLTPKLQNNKIDGTAMASLARGQWPKLGHLSLSGNTISVLGLELLMAAQWPNMNGLTLDRSNVTVATWALLNLPLPAPNRKRGCGFFSASRVLSDIAVD